MLNRSRHNLWILPLCIALLGAMIFTWGDNPALFLSMTILLIIGSYIIKVNFRTGRIFSWRFGIPAFYLMMFFIMPLSNQLLGNKDFSNMEGVNRAVLIAAIGLVLFQMGLQLYHALFKRLSPQIKTRSLAQYWPLSAANRISKVWLTLLIGSAAHYFSFRYGYYGLNYVDIPDWSFAGVATSFSALAEIASIIAWVRYYQNKSPNILHWRILALTSTLILVLFSIGANSKWFLVQPFIIIIFAQYAGRRNVGFRWIALLAFLYIVVVYPAILLYRATYTPGVDRGTLIILFLKTIASPEMWSVYAENWTAFIAGVDRGLLQTFTTIVSQTGHEVEYVLGATYRQGFEALVPRFIWADKPSLNLGNFIGQYYGLIGPYDEITNISPI